jgi:hypothetical protein
VLSLPLRPGDRILLYTDGVIEARDLAGNFYPLAERCRGSYETTRVRHCGESTAMSCGTSAAGSTTTRR